MSVTRWSAGRLGLVALLGCGPGTAASEDAGETTAVTGSSSADATGESGETGDDAPMDCGHVAIVPTHVNLPIAFVVDTSPSMARLWDHDGDPNTPMQTRWQTAYALLDGIAGVLSPWWAVALQRFPSADACPGASVDAPTCADASACTTADALELGFTIGGMPALLAALPPADGALEFRGATPAAGAYASAVAQLLAYEDPQGDPVPRHVVLITDGHVDCALDSLSPANVGVLDAGLVEQVAAAFTDHEITTMVIAVDPDAEVTPGPDTLVGVDPRVVLETLAQVGGFANSYTSATDPDVLNYFDSEDTVGSCVLELSFTDQGPPTPEQVPLVTASMNGEPLPYVEPDACATAATGWSWLVGDGLPPGEILMFCGATCATFKQADGNVFEVFYGCPDSP